MLIPDFLPDLLAVIWFVLCWVGYTRYSHWKGLSTPCLSSVLHLYRQDWMRRLLLRDNRIADASVIGNLERNASFFASSTLVIPPFLALARNRGQAARANFCLGVMPPRAIFGLS